MTEPVTPRPYGEQVSAAPIYMMTAGGLIVELEASHNIVIDEPRLDGHVRITVTDVGRLIETLTNARIIRAGRERDDLMAGRQRIPVPVDLTAQQRRVVETPGVAYLGRDEKGRPIVEALAGIPQQVRRWALSKRGEPLDITGTVAPPEDDGA